MPVTDAFLETCRNLVVVRTEYTGFITARNAVEDARGKNSPDRWRLWDALWQQSDSPAMAAKGAVREVVNANYAAAGRGPLDRESAVAELCRRMGIVESKRPATQEEESAFRAELDLQNRTS
jgi:hypothetical protein